VVPEMGPFRVCGPNFAQLGVIRCDAMPTEPRDVVYEIRVRGRRLVSTKVLEDAKWAARAAAQAGEGAKVVNRETGEVIERYPPP
jgi:hypothetical protein